MKFSSLGLSESICKAVSDKKYTQATPIQIKAIPAVLAGRDVMAAAQTGTGKTAAFTLPILEKLSKANQRVKCQHIQALILTPTRELAAQIHESVKEYGKHLSLSSYVIFGGVKANPQISELRKGVNILIATPGRLIDLCQQDLVKFEQLSILVLDEADRMLDMGFINDIKKIMRRLPPKRQNLMFSATFSNEIISLAKNIVYKPVEISINPKQTTANTIKQWVIPVDKKRKAELVAHMINANNWEQVLLFSKTKHGANRLAELLNKAQITSLAIHGNKSQGARTKALAQFKQGELRVLVATDIAARGLDIEQLPIVINFDLPNVPEDYVHRIGRTGRAGLEGQAISLVTPEEYSLLSAIETLIKKVLERTIEKGFEPSSELPHSHLNRRAPTVKKNTKPKINISKNPKKKKTKSKSKPQNKPL